ncbi:VanZ family protein [Viridibacillus sp. YIM B01967]|uniref:VanZ family protein n=1 Tax=Viridibacillus soli TaxID=2798301 RepID=A0ABS1H8M7_9BACL|nr:VanZ family protein [Viridibacillus soli]MBK3495766.1 VanZ family protein [Viridibacillus soli]
MSDILYYLLEMIPVMIIAIPFVVYLRFKSRKSKGNPPTNRLHELGLLLFSVYVIGLFYETIVPRNGMSLQYFQMRFQEDMILGVNLKLFQVFTDVYNAIHYLDLWQPFFINFLGNIAIFMPIGFLMPLLWRKMEIFAYVFITALCLSIFIETMQLPQMRSTDVDDLWLNTLGAVLGFIVYKWVKKLIPSIETKCKQIV